MQLVECVPNFSEGRDKIKVDAIVNAAASADGVRVLDVEMDKDHNRCVLTIIGAPDAVLEGAFRAAATARQAIDMNQHKGEHPRIGATDVVPFIPVSGVSMDDCIRLARKLGDRIGKELEIPVYLYGQAAARVERRDLATVRKGQYEGLKTAIESDPDRKPDYGPARMHPTAGATAVGAREQIVNFNVNLDFRDMEAGKAIAKKIRTSGGGLPELRAKEIQLSSGNVQISTVLTDYHKTSLMTVYRAVSVEAASRGAKVLGSEIVGLMPRDALTGAAVESLQLQGFQSKAQVLEEKLGGGDKASWKDAAALVSAALASSDPTPGGGSAAAICGAMGAGLAQMAVDISLQSKKLDLARKPGLERASRTFVEARKKFLQLCSLDSDAFDNFMAVLKTPKTEPGRRTALQNALFRAAEVPMDTALLAAQSQLQAIEMVPLVMEAVGSDMRCALALFRSAAFCAAENVRINSQSFEDKTAAHAMENQLKKILAGMA